MITPPDPPNPSQDTIEILPPSRPRSARAKLVIGLSVTMCITFGLCSVTLMSSPDKIGGFVFPTAIVIEAICLAGLLILGTLTIIDAFRRK